MSFGTVFQTVIVALSARYFVDSIDNQWYVFVKMTFSSGLSK